MITVACVWVKANVPYGVEYVTNLRAMVKKHLPRPFRFVCLTDRPEQLPASLEAIRVSLPSDTPGWWAKAYLFDMQDELGARVLYLDLDTVIVSDLSPIVDYSAGFALVPDGGTFKPRTHHRVVKRFNSSVMVWDRGVPPPLGHVSALANVFWGDQDVIGERAPWAQQMPAEWFPRLSELNGQPPNSDAKVVLCKKPKNEIAARQYPWVAEAWRAA